MLIYRCRLPPGMKLLSIDRVKTSSWWEIHTFINKRHTMGEMIVSPAKDAPPIDSGDG